jgi:peroxiredoxin
MKSVLTSLAAFALLAALPLTARAAEELEATLKVSGRVVEVRVRHKDGRPAAGVPVRLLYGRQLTAAAATTDGQGRCAPLVTRPGSYEAVIETGPDAADSVRVPFLVLDAAGADHAPRTAAAVGLGCLLGAAVLFVALRWKRRGREAAATSAASGLPGTVLLAAGVGLLSWAAWHHLHRPTPPDAAPEPDVADAARGFLRERNVRPLSGPLAGLLADTRAEREPSQEHPLLGQRAPDFELSDHLRQPWRLGDRLARGPVVLVFYYGYHCNHCVGQLFALHDDVGKFRELGAEVVAVSGDPPEWTRERFRQYGAFAFPVLSDPGNQVAQAYGAYRPASGKTREDLQHATFVIGRDGRVRWAYRGNQPFTGNRTLLYELARLEGRLPDGRRE